MESRYPTSASRLARRLAGLFCAATLASAAAASAQDTPAPAPPTTPASQPADSAGPVLTLDEAVTYALEHNPLIGQAAAAVRAARARVGQRQAVRRPQLSMENQFFYQGPIIQSPAASTPITPDIRWSVGVFLSQILFDWGQRSHLQRSAERETDAAGERVGETKNGVRLVVATAYYNILRAEELLRVAEERRAAAAEQLRVASERFKNDVSPRFDVIRSEAEVANAEQDVIAAQNEIALANATLNTALGRNVAIPVDVEPQSNELTPPVPFETARAVAIKARPELNAIRAEVAAGLELVKARRAENKPQVSLNGAYDRRTATGFNKGYAYNVGLVMTFPFLDSGLTKNRVREAQADTDSDRQQLEIARQQVELDLKQALLDMEEARKRVSTAEKEVQSAKEAQRVADVRYRAGVGTNIEVTDAQLAVARAGQNVANARFDFLTAQARAENAAGAPVTALR